MVFSRGLERDTGMKCGKHKHNTTLTREAKLIFGTTNAQKMKFFC